MLTATQKRNAQKKRAKERIREQRLAEITSDDFATTDLTIDVVKGVVSISRCNRRAAFWKETPHNLSLDSGKIADHLYCDETRCSEATIEAPCSLPLGETAITRCQLTWAHHYHSFDCSSGDITTITEVLRHVENIVKEGFPAPFEVILYNSKGEELDKWRVIGTLEVEAADVVAAAESTQDL